MGGLVGPRTWPPNILQRLQACSTRKLFLVGEDRLKKLRKTALSICEEV